MTVRPSSTAVKRNAIAARKRALASSLAQMGDSTGAFWERKEAAALAQTAQEALTLPAPPTVGIGGEATLSQYPEPATVPLADFLRDTLAAPDLVTAEASYQRMALLQQVTCLELGLDLAETLHASNSLEKLLAHQMAAAHQAAMTLLAQSLTLATQARPSTPADTIESARLANTAARLMAAFQDGVHALAKLRTGGRSTQTVIVQHVAVVTGERPTEGPRAVGAVAANGGTIPCPERSTPLGQHRAVGRKRGKARPAVSRRSTANGAAGCMEAPTQAPREAISTP
jgi:hypothetical protein